MNKKLLFGIMSLAALTACTNDDFESQNVAEEVSPIQFEVINNDVVTRASMSGNTIVWNADQGDLFTLYHGAADGAVAGFENAIYKANRNAEGATLTTPTMIKEGRAIMVWPVDTTFRIKTGDKLTITIPNPLVDVANNIPYVSDLVKIEAYKKYSETPEPPTYPNGTAYNSAGYSRKYPVYMRPMASQLTLKADYNETDGTIAKLYEGGTDPLIAGDPITPITVTSVSLLTQAGGLTQFTKTIPVKWTDPSVAIQGQWDAATGENAKNAWEKVTDYNVAGIDADGEKVAKLTTKCLVGNESSKFLILPQANMAGAVAQGAVEVNTYYGKVLIADPTVYAESKYSVDEYNAAWYRIVSSAKAATTWENASTPVTIDGVAKHKVVAKSTGLGMAQTLNDFSAHTAGSGITEGEPCGYSLNRYVIVDLTKLDMSGLHVKDDKQLRDVVRVWKKLGLGAVTVYLDGDKTNHEFAISQKTIETINTINNGGLSFQVKPCREPHVVGVDDEFCDKIVITGADYKQDIQNIAFIAPNENTDQADVVLANEATAWKWNGTVKVTDAGVNQIINKGTMENAATATLATKENNGTQNNIPFVNNGTWKITAGTLNVQFDVTNYGNVNIATNAQYRQDGQAGATTFINEATGIPARFTFSGVIPRGDDKVGKVENKGVFATVSAGVINNYGLIEHADLNAKTYITRNDNGGAGFGTAFGGGNKIGRINLPWDNKNEDNVSVSAALNSGFVSVTVDGEVSGALDASVVGNKVNYVIVKSGITEIQAVAAQVKYLEINQPGTELAWNVPTTTEYDGLIVLSDVNIKLGTKIVATVTYLGADMYVGGKFNQAILPAEAPDPAYPATNFSGYYGDTSGNVGSKYITY